MLDSSSLNYKVLVQIIPLMHFLLVNFSLQDQIISPSPLLFGAVYTQRDILLSCLHGQTLDKLG